MVGLTPPPSAAPPPPHTHRAAAFAVGAIVPPLLLLFAVILIQLRARAAKRAKAEKQDDAYRQSLCEQPAASEAGISAPPNAPAEPPTECAAVGQIVRFRVGESEVATDASLLDEPPADLLALRRLLARIGTEALRRPLVAEDLNIEFGITADVWLTATSATPMHAVLRASHGLRVTEMRSASAATPDEPAPAMPSRPRAAGGPKANSPAMQWVRSMGPATGAPQSGAGGAAAEEQGSGA